MHYGFFRSGLQEIVPLQSDTPLTMEFRALNGERDTTS
jgi:hypothetical protein